MPFDDDKSPWGPTPQPYEDRKWMTWKVILCVVAGCGLFWSLIWALGSALIAKVTQG